MIVSVPAAVPVGVYITKHDAVPVVVPAANVQGEVANVPVPLVLKSTVPVGVIAVPTSLSVTVTVHFVAVPMLTDAGRHATVVVVVRIKVNWTVVILPS